MIKEYYEEREWLNTWSMYPRISHKYEHEDWEFTKRLKYITSYTQENKPVIYLDVEVRALEESDIPNPNYCKYFGDQRRKIKGYKTWWISSNSFAYREPRKETTVEIMECDV